MNQQHDSLLFRIPCELRDEIYHYCVLEEDGYHHESTSEKLRLANRDPINLALQYTCKKAFEEIAGLALKTNTITFRTMLDVPEPGRTSRKPRVGIMSYAKEKDHCSVCSAGHILRSRSRVCAN
jgi:hypothetical protein